MEGPFFLCLIDSRQKKKIWRKNDIRERKVEGICEIVGKKRERKKVTPSSAVLVLRLHAGC